jgi:hypothetical protein
VEYRKAGGVCPAQNLQNNLSAAARQPLRNPWW